MKKKTIINIILIIVCVVLVAAYLFPFLVLVLNSFKAKLDILQNPLALPTEINFENYLIAFDKMNYLSSIFNSFIVTAVSVVILNIFASMFAYYLQRNKNKFTKIIMGILVVSMLIPFQTLMLPFVSLFGRLKMLDSVIYLIIFYLGFGISFTTFIYSGFIDKIPKEMDESCAVEGASKLQTFWMVIFPQLKTTTATVSILNVLWFWNDYLLPSLVLQGDGRTLPLMTYSFFGRYTSDYGLAMAGLMLSVIPIIIFYIVMQRQIVSGITDGAIK